MQFIDTHTHIYLPEFESDRDEVVNRALECSVVKMLMPNVDVETVNIMLHVASKYPTVCYPMAGLHPTSVKKDYPKQLGNLESLFDKHKFIAVGEIGIDLYWDKTHLEEQIIAFKRQLLFALGKRLPVVIHARESFREIFSVLNEFKGSDLKGVFHAFSGTQEDAEKVIGMGFKLGIGGVVTFKNSGLDKIVKEAGLENIVLETDSPYLAPVPYRGKRNESSFIPIINQKIAGIFGMMEDEVASIMYSNTCLLFNL